MSTPVGHILGSLTVYEGAKHTLLRKYTIPRYWLWIVVLCAVLPDLDHIALILSPRLEAHLHGPTHSLIACALLAATITAILKCTRNAVSAWRLFLVFMLCTATHPLLDYLMGIGPGVQFLWPISKYGWLSPIALQPTSYYALSGSRLLSLLWYPPTLQAIAFELAAFIPLLMISQVKFRKQKLLLVLISFSVFSAIHFTYQPFKRHWDARGAEQQRQMREQRINEARQSNQEMHRTK